MAYANDAFGATNSSKLSLHLRSILAVTLLLPSCTNALISSRRTISASPFRFTPLFTDGHSVRTNCAKFFPVIVGLRYSAGAALEYHPRDTKVLEWRAPWAFFVHDRWEKIWMRSSGGRWPEGSG